MSIDLDAIRERYNADPKHLTKMQPGDVAGLLAMAEEYDWAAAQLAAATRERDAEIAQLHGICAACKNYSPYHYHGRGRCAKCTYEYLPDKDATDMWEWAGPQKGDSNGTD